MRSRIYYLFWRKNETKDFMSKGLSLLGYVHHKRKAPIEGCFEKEGADIKLDAKLIK